MRTILIVSAIFLTTSASAPAQEIIIPYTKAPETPAEYWAAMRYEISLGNFNRAADHFRNFHNKLTALPPEDQKTLLLKLHDSVGIGTFLRLGNIPQIRAVTNRDANNRDVALADTLVQRINQLVEARLADPVRIERHIAALSKSPEERIYALTQLRQSGPRAVPLLVSVLRDPTRAREHGQCLAALQRMNADSNSVMLAMMDIHDPIVLRSTAIDLLKDRAEDRLNPYLWYCRANSQLPEPLRQQSGQVLASRLGLRSAEQLTGDPRNLLTLEADKYYRHQAELPHGDKLNLWQWDAAAGALTSKPVSRSEYEEFYCAYWSRKALDLDPGYRPAQVMLVSGLLEKAVQLSGVDQPLEKAAPELVNLLVTTDPDILAGVLDRALAESRTGTALGAIRILQRIGESRLVQSRDRSPAALVQALSYPDRRVQLGAALAVLRVPTRTPFAGSNRVVEVLARSLSSAAPMTALILHAHPTEGKNLGEQFRKIGYTPIVLSNHREFAVRASRGDVDLLVIDPQTAATNLPFMMSSLRSGSEKGLAPILVWAPPEMEKDLKQRFSKVPRLSVAAPLDPDNLKALIEKELGDPFSPPLNDEERRTFAENSLGGLLRIARGEYPAYDLAPAEPALLEALARDESSVGAAEVLSHRPSQKIQKFLAEAVTVKTRPDELRAMIAYHLHASMQRHGNRLGVEHTTKILALVKETDHPQLREAALRLVNSLVPDARTNGERLRGFQPMAPMPQVKPEQ